MKGLVGECRSPGGYKVKVPGERGGPGVRGHAPLGWRLKVVVSSLKETARIPASSPYPRDGRDVCQVCASHLSYPGSAANSQQ